MDNRLKDYTLLTAEDGLNINDDIYPAQLQIAWKQSGMSQAGGRRPSRAVRNARTQMSWGIAGKVAQGVAQGVAQWVAPLTLQEMSWLTVMRLQYGYTLDAGGTFHPHMGDLTPGPCEGLSL